MADVGTLPRHPGPWPPMCRRVKIAVADITEEQIAARLALAGIPDPDLMIRTGGEQRISNFLLWNLAYTELYFFRRALA